MTKTLAHITTYENRLLITYAIIGMSVILAFVYVGNIYSIVSHSVALERNSALTAEVSAAIERLDSEYVALTHDITPDRLTDHGMSQGKVTTYISRPSSLGLVTETESGHEL